MPPLPPTLECYHDQASIVNTYNIILRLEKAIQGEIDSGKKMEKQMIYCQILGYLFHHFPGRQLNDDFVREISTISSDDEKLLELGQHFYQFFMRLCASSKLTALLQTYLTNKVISSQKHTRTPSSDSSRSSFDEATDQMKDMSGEAPQNYQTAKKLALARDGYQCVVTKSYDAPAAMRNSELREIVYREQGSVRITHCAHIFPELITANSTSGSNMDHCTASVWAVLDCLGYQHLREELNGSNIHRLENVMTMDLTTHLLFDSLWIWLSETSIPNTYRLEASTSVLLNHRPEYVTFATTDPKYPLPSPNYLAIRAACAKVAHLSGAAKYIAEVLSRMEDTCVLAEDGGSAELLHEAILSSMQAI
ncbi:hypothetical protein F5J12DRAFT_896501 [Pisolithus orientalis]|uniref:uncharacterized protein n=1 Tax=Pisolithus orientalis TaxID=936130 RepID=UPI002224D9BF|nr:uncharacterized protein F5J12DRAFT_896501 [Pisolithus orientalis]KAI5995279.1 hypothetical protein F5J12DRAFT_896501 [Pisolithus orientalis]